MTETDAQRIDRLGLNDCIQALEDIWNTKAMYYIQDQRTADLKGYGYEPLDAFDAIWHELESWEAHRYMKYGFTAHQAMLFGGNKQAQNNLLDGDFMHEHVDDALGMDMPLDLMAKILFVAKSHDETRAFIDGCTGAGPGPDGTEDPAAVVEQIELLASLQANPVNVCDCEHPWGNA